MLGKKKAIELLHATEDVIENGGILTSVSCQNRSLYDEYYILLFLSLSRKNKNKNKRKVIDVARQAESTCSC